MKVVSPNMKLLSSWPQSDRAKIVGVFTDIDDTLTTEGSITPDAFQALQDLTAAGLMVIPITGRPVGWQRSRRNLTQQRHQKKRLVFQPPQRMQACSLRGAVFRS